MRISRLLAELLRIKREHGDIEVTCTGTTLDDGFCLRPPLEDVYETTVENLVVDTHPTIGKRVRVYR